MEFLIPLECAANSSRRNSWAHTKVYIWPGLVCNLVMVSSFVSNHIGSNNVFGIGGGCGIVSPFF